MDYFVMSERLPPILLLKDIRKGQLAPNTEEKKLPVTAIKGSLQDLRDPVKKLAKPSSFFH